MTEQDLTASQQEICRKLGVARASYAALCRTGVNLLKGNSWASHLPEVRYDPAYPIRLDLEFKKWPRRFEKIPARFPAVNTEYGEQPTYSGTGSDLVRMQWRLFSRQGEVAVHAHYSDSGALRFQLWWSWLHRIGRKWRGSHFTLCRRPK